MSGVVLNVTVTNPTVAGFVTIFPTGAAKPVASNLNFVPGQTVPNLVEVKLGTGGKVSAFNNAGTTDLIFDVAGWIGPEGEDTTAGLYHPLQPARLLDTRDGTGASGPGPVGGGSTITLQVTGAGGVPATGVSAVALNLTATAPTTNTFVTAFPADASKPLASNLNPAAGQTVPNRVIVKVSASGAIKLFNNGGSVHLIVDVSGWYTDDTDANAIGGRFTGIAPVRVLDTRPSSPVGGGGTTNPKIVGNFGIPAMDGQVPPTAVVANVTVTEPTSAGFLTAFPSQAHAAARVGLELRAQSDGAELGDRESSVPTAVSRSSTTPATPTSWSTCSAGTPATSSSSATAKPLQDADLAKLTGLVGPDSTTLVFNPIPASLANVQVGDTLVGGISLNSPSGLLKKVLAVNVNGSTLTLTVENGSLSDVILQGDLNGAAPLDATQCRCPVDRPRRPRSRRAMSTRKPSVPAVPSPSASARNSRIRHSSTRSRSVAPKPSKRLHVDAQLAALLGVCVDVKAEASLTVRGVAFRNRYGRDLR